MSLNDLTKLLQEVKQSKSTSEIFLSELALTASKEALKEARKPSKTFKPSSIGSCERMIYYILTGLPPTDVKETLEGIGICESGTDRHERLQKLISKMDHTEWIDVADYVRKREFLGTTVIEQKGMETKCYNTLHNMSFLCDGLINFHGTKYILEIKTEMGMKFGKRLAPEPKHLLQATCYSICLGIDKVLFLYEDRNICLKKMYEVEVTEEMKKQVFAIMDRVNLALQESQVPPKSTNKKDCTYCQYKKVCRA